MTGNDSRPSLWERFVNWETGDESVLDGEIEQSMDQAAPQEAGGEVVHICSCAFSTGSRVHGIIDWRRRIACMREHSGEHVLSGIICRSYGCSNIGFHMGKDFVTVDFSRRLTDEEIAAAQEAALSFSADVIFGAPLRRFLFSGTMGRKRRRSGTKRSWKGRFASWRSRGRTCAPVAEPM